jgi:hypothetical protein
MFQKRYRNAPPRLGKQAGVIALGPQKKTRNIKTGV